MAYKIADAGGWNYWQAGSKPRAFKTRNTEFFEFESWEEMAEELKTFGIVHPWNVSPFDRLNDAPDRPPL